MSAIRRLRHAVVAALVGLMLAGAALAQATPEQRDYYDTWLKTAQRAEQVVDARRASNAALEKLRQEIAGYRQVFAETREANTARIATLQSQLDALGPKPEEDKEEPEDIAALRASLTEQLNTLRVPRVVAEEAHNRANGLISEIDKIIRERQTRRFLSRGPSPLNPEYWPDAMRDVQNSLGSLYNETAAQAASPASREKTRENLILILGLLALGIVLLLRARRWAERFGDYLRRFGGSGSGVWSFVVSLTKIFLPLAGVYAIVQAVTLTGALSLRSTLIAEALPQWAATFLYVKWLADQMIPKSGDEALVPVADDRKRAARTYFSLLALMLVLKDAVGLFGQIESISAASHAVISFPVIVLTALILMRLQSAINRNPVAIEDDSERWHAFVSIVYLVRRAVFLLGATAPFIAAAGYIHAAEAIIYPVVATLMLIALGLVLQRFFSDVYAMISGKGDAARDSLFSVLAGFVLTLLAVPVLALIWGARVADLTEVWTKFLEGFQVGDISISPQGFVVFAVVFAGGYMITRLLQGGLRNSLLPKTSIDPGGQNAIVSGAGYIGIFLAALAAVAVAGFDLSSIALVAGALSVGIGFGLQTIVSNFVSGIILLIERPISKGDWVEIGGVMGYVRDISVRATRIETFDRTDVIVPNSDLIAGTVTNYTRGNTIGRVIVPVGVAYGTDTRRVEAILMEIAKAHPMVLANPSPNVVFQGFGADSLDFEIRAILRDVNWMLSVRSDMNYEIARRFEEEEIEIPFAQRDVWLRNPEVLVRNGTSSQDPAGAGDPGSAETASENSAAPVPPDPQDMEPPTDET